MTKEEKVVVRAAIVYVAATDPVSHELYDALEEAVLGYLETKAEEVGDAGLAEEKSE